MKRIGGIVAWDIITALDLFMKRLIDLPENPDPGRNYGYFAILSRKDGRPLLVVQVGSCPKGKAGDYFALACEKAMRLYNAPNDKSSWQSRNEKLRRYGGAIATGDFIFSFSGLSELADEALMLQLARACYTQAGWHGATKFWTHPDEIDKISAISQNRLYESLRAEIRA